MISEIELEKGRISLQCFDVDGNLRETIENAEKFNLEQETPGFHDYEFSNELSRGYFSFIEPFEVECLVEGMTTQELKKRIKTCEFIANDDFMFAWGNSSATKLLYSFGNSDFSTVNKVEFNTDDLYAFQNTMTTVKSISLKNPKGKEVRTVNLKGVLDCYTEYDVIDPKHHTINSVTGVFTQTPVGKLTITATNKGIIRIAGAKGLILDFSTILWVFKQIQVAKGDSVCYTDSSLTSM